MRNPLPRLRTRALLLRLHLGLAAVAYLPLVVTRPGWVSADTKTYLYLDPGQLMGRASSMWDPSIGLGTVPHQRIGFLWPMGPFYWLAETVGIPDWLAQRLWWGTIIFAAGSGVAYLLRSLGWRGPGVTAAAFVYALSPVSLTLIARLSGVLLPFCGLPWLVAFAIQTVRHRGWRYPALFALTVATFGSVNATGLLLVGVAPLLWLPYAVRGVKEATPRQAALAGLKIAALTVPVSAWWIAGLNVQRTHGIEIIRYTETAKVVASASVSHEVLRGLGYWFFYGRDRLGPWIEPSRTYTELEPVIAVTYLIPLLGIAGAALARWRHRGYYVGLIVVGTALAVGAYPWDHNPLFGQFVQGFQSSDAGLAMRSLPRAVPLVVLGTAVLLGSGVASLARRWPRLRRPTVIGAVALAILAMPPLWMGQFVPDNLRRPEEVPQYWRDAANHLEEQGDDTRVLVIPGSDFAAYGWGSTVDPILPGLMDRPSVQREAIPNGTPVSAHLLDALDLALQERTADPDAIAPLARLMRAGDILVVGDWQYERNSIPDPGSFWRFMRSAGGFGEPATFGEGTAALEGHDPPDLGVLPVADAPSIIGTHSTDQPLLVAGDATGLVDAAGAGLIDGTELIRYSASLDEDDIAAALEDGAALLLTDTNRKRGERWNTLRHNRGHTETAEGGPLATDLGDNRLPVFPGAGTDTMTVAERRGPISAEATSYGNAITYVPEERPMMAVDGNTRTAWRTAAYADARGERLELTLEEPTTTDQVRLLQPDGDGVTRYITKARLRFDDGDPVDVELTGASRRGPGELFTFPEATFSKLSIEVLADSAGRVPRYAGLGGVGLSEVAIGDVANPKDPASEAVRLPTDMLSAAGEDSLDSPLAVLLTRQRQDPTDPARFDEEGSLVRTLELPTDRDFGLVGSARLSSHADAETLEALLGRPRSASAVLATTSKNPPGAVLSPAWSVVDGDPSTNWANAPGDSEVPWVQLELPAPVTVDSIPVTFVDDDTYSPPTEVVVSVDGEEVATVEIPEGAGSPIDLDIPEVTGSTFRITIDGFVKNADDWFDPVAIAEVGLPGAQVAPLPETFDSGCRDDLLTVGDESFPVRVTGTTLDALADIPLDVTPCGSASEVALQEGRNEIRTAPGSTTGIDVDQLVLRSAPGGTEAPASHDPRLVEDVPAGPTVEVVADDDAHARVRVTGATPGEPFWLVLGQSFSAGWHATTSGGDVSSDPTLVDGFANGWLVTPDEESLEVSLDFAPQRGVTVALWISVAAALLCVALALRPSRRSIVAASAAPEPFSAKVFRFEGKQPSRVVAVAVGIGMGVFGWVLAGLVVGVVVGVVAGVAARRPSWRRVVLLGSVAALALAGLYVVYLQWVHDPHPSLDWPFEMRRGHLLGWLAVLLLAVDVVLNRLWRRDGRDRVP